MKRILITGADSYIGSNVEKWLRRTPEDYDIDVLDVREKNWVDCDFSKFDVVFHVAGIAHRNDASEELYEKVNHQLAVNVAGQAIKAKVKQLIFMSSGAVYTQSDKLHSNIIVEESSKLEPRTAYGISKMKAEKDITEMIKSLNSSMKFVILRPPTVYGPNAKGNYNKLAKLSVLAPVFPKVKNARSMIYIDNLCEFIHLCIENGSDGVFLPQNADYINTTCMVKEIAKVNGKKMFTTPLFNWAIKLLGKYINSINKIFGTYCYEKKEYFGNKYQLIDFVTSIKLCEKGNNNGKNDSNSEYCRSYEPWRY